MSEIRTDKARILVIDDNEQNRALARATLEEEGHEVVLAASGEEGLRAFESNPPDCVLLDVRMPGMDGFVVCTRIRALASGADTPIVFLTAQRDLDTFDAALRAGGDDFLTKPVRPTELVLRVQGALRLRRLNASNREYYDLVRRQRDDLMRLQLQKERLSAFVVHDLKNPVATVDLHAQLLLRDRELPEHVHESAASIRDEVRSLMRLLLNLLDISKSEEGRLVPVNVDIDLPSWLATRRNEVTVLFVVLPLAVAFSAAAVAAFLWSARNGQLDDLETPALRMLRDDADAKPPGARAP